jgi:hypothetical protein
VSHTLDPGAADEAADLGVDLVVGEGEVAHGRVRRNGDSVDVFEESAVGVVGRGALGHEPRLTGAAGSGGVLGRLTDHRYDGLELGRGRGTALVPVPCPGVAAHRGLHAGGRRARLRRLLGTARSAVSFHADAAHTVFDFLAQEALEPIQVEFHHDLGRAVGSHRLLDDRRTADEAVERGSGLAGRHRQVLDRGAAGDVKPLYGLEEVPVRIGPRGLERENRLLPRGAGLGGDGGRRESCEDGCCGDRKRGAEAGDSEAVSGHGVLPSRWAVVCADQ